MTYNQQLVQNQNQYYDYKNINYQEITTDQWQDVPVQQTDYSNYWASPDSFAPQTFSKNTQAQHKWNDLCWNFSFWINFLITLILFGYLSSLDLDSEYIINTNSTQSTDSSLLLDTNSTSSNSTFSTSVLTKSIFGGLGISVLLNIIHLCYAFFFPVVYIYLGLLFCLLFAIIVSIVLFIQSGSYLFFIFPAFYILIAIIWYCIARNYIAISAAILKVSIRIVLSYPSTIFILLLEQRNKRGK